MALQGVEDVTERRRRAIRRGRGLLDRLDALKLAMLAGRDAEGALSALGEASRESLAEEGLDDGLRAVLAEIDTRAAVELAKAEVARRQG
jgi:hypothetical protein